MTHPHAGPISAEQLRSLFQKQAYWDWIASNPGDNEAGAQLAAGINTLVAPLLQAAAVNAAGEMRERCAKVCEDQADGHNVALIAVSVPVIRAVPLPPAEESFLREKIELAIEAGIEYADERKEWTPSPGDWRGPERPTYEDVMSSKSK